MNLELFAVGDQVVLSQKAKDAIIRHKHLLPLLGEVFTVCDFVVSRRTLHAYYRLSHPDQKINAVLQGMTFGINGTLMLVEQRQIDLPEISDTDFHSLLLHTSA